MAKKAAKTKTKSKSDELMVFDTDKAFGVVFKHRENLNVFCPFHEDPASSKSASCSINVAGYFRCQVCGSSGGAAAFYAKVHEITEQEASSIITVSVDQLADRGPGTVRQDRKRIDQSVVRINQTLLAKTERFRNYLLAERGLTPVTLERYHIGCDEHRIAIPIFDAEGSLVNIRRYLPHHQNYPKMLTHIHGDGSPVLYPVNVLDGLNPGDQLIICEGEWDALLLNQEGLPAITNTGNVSVWSPSWTLLLAERGLDLVIIFDVNDKDDDLGQRIAWQRADELQQAGCSVRIVRLPLPETYIGGDITNWFVDEKRTAIELQAIINETPSFESQRAETSDASGLGNPPPRVVSPGSEDDLDQLPIVPLHEASQAQYFFKTIKMRCLVAGKGIAPYLLPSKMHVEITEEDGALSTVIKEFDAWDGVILSLIQCTKSAQKNLIRAILDVPPTQRMSITITETLNVEEIFVIPSIENTSEASPYVLRRCFYVGHGLETNRVYDFIGYTLPDPHTQAATHVLVSAVPAETSIDQFQLSDIEAAELRRVFGTDNKTVYDRMSDVGEQLSQHCTRIYGREDLHTAINLAIHSPLSFDFNGVRLRKGWLECLVIGDTRTGKGFVTEGLLRHYRVGEVVSGENMSRAGLVGGVQRVGDRWTLVWGKIPLADRRLIVMDECSSLSIDDIGKLSRIRSEGVAEITKIVSEKTTARTRLIWLSNPRATSGGGGSARMIADYNYGIEAATELIGAPEDMARFDYVLVVAQNEVDSMVINAKHKPDKPLTYTSDLCHKLVTWVWSRRSENIRFDDDTVELALKAAQELGRKFSSKICLVQVEDVRYKLARIAAAAAACTFNSPDGEILVVSSDHIEYAYNFLYYIYSKPCCGYAQLSAADHERSVLGSPKEVRTTLELAGDALPDLVDGLLEHNQITTRDIADYAGVDIFQAREMMSLLVRYRALIKSYNWYVKKPAFKSFLTKIKAELTDEAPVTQEDEEISDA